jgi:hypothetical protein
MAQEMARLLGGRENLLGALQERLAARPAPLEKRQRV